MRTLRAAVGTDTDPDHNWVAPAELFRAALESDISRERFERLRERLPRADSGSRYLLPLYTWVAAHAVRSSEPELTRLGDATVRWDFDSLLAGATLLGIEGKTMESLKFLNAVG